MMRCVKSLLICTFFLIAIQSGDYVFSATPGPTISILSPSEGKVVWTDGASYPVRIIFKIWDVDGLNSNSLIFYENGFGIPVPAANIKTYGQPDTYYFNWYPVENDYIIRLKASDTTSQEGSSRKLSLKVRVANVNTAGIFPGDGKLLVRDNDNNICISCHNLMSHSSGDFKSTKYGNWERVCRDCHTPHNTKNIFLLQSSFMIYTGVNQGYSTRRKVDFRNLTGMGRYGFVTVTGMGFEKRGPCEVCHTRTNHFRFDGSGPDQTHENIGGKVTLTQEACIDRCHLHTGGFAHGVGSTGTGCVECHGHEAGTEIDPDMTYPWTGGSGQYSAGKGTTTPHSTHTESFIAGAAGDDDRRGPGIYCSTCHDINSIPRFNDGKNLAETTVCDNCHSPGGSYDGVNDPIIGAKNNWHSGGVYNNNTALKAGKEKWCAGCHDENAAVIDSVTAPNVIGDEDGAHAYGVGWGFYKTGHGLAVGNYPASEAPASARNCPDCHNTTLSHIDGEHRTYSAASNNYQAGYRLRVAMDIPRKDAGEPVSDFGLCFSCHNWGPFLIQNNYTTNFRQDVTTNDHWRHLQGPSTGMWSPSNTGTRWDSDWDGTGDSMLSCPACHNVHGSPSPKMLRHGELISTPGTTDKVPALNFKYLPLTSPVLMESTGGMLNSVSPGSGSVANTGVCNMCHSNQDNYTRTPRDIYPPWITGVYGSVGSDQLFVGFSKGVYTNTGGSGALLISDFTFTDLDNGRTLSSIVHTAGDTYATITLSSALDGTNDIDTDTLAAATASSVYDLYDNKMDTKAVPIMTDTVPPSSASLVPSNGSVDISIDSNLSVSLLDSDIGVDFTTFSITLTGDKGYSKTYTDLSTAVVSKTGERKSYSVTIDPDANFSYSETITVSVNVDDYAGNSLSPPSWSFTTSAVAIPQNITLHPSDVSNAYSFTTYGGAWADILDGNDGLSTYVHRCGGSGYPGDSTSRFAVAMDDSGLGAVTIQSIEVGVAAKYAPSCPVSGTTSGTMGICYKTGTNTVCSDKSMTGDFTVYTATYTTDSDGGALDVADIDNLIVEVQRKSTGSIHLIVSEVYVKVTYLPSGGSASVSGTVYTDEGLTPIADGATVRLIVNGSSVGTATTSGGAYSIDASTSAGDNVITYIDGHAYDGTTVTVSGGGSLSGLDIYADRLITRNDNGGNLSNALMSSAKGAYSDTEILYSVSGGNLTVAGANTELFVPAGYTFAPAGSVTTANIDVNGTFNDGGNTINISRNWDVDTTGSFISSGTINFNATSGTNIILPGGTDGSHDFQNIVFNDGGGTAVFQLAGHIMANGNFTVTNGLVDTTASNYDITVGGNFSQAVGAQLNANGSVITVTGNFSADGSADDVDPLTYPATVVSTYYNNATVDMAGTASTLTYLNVNSNWANGIKNLNVGHDGATDTVVGNLAVRGVLSVGSGAVTGASIMYIRGEGNPLNFDPSANVSVGSLRFNGLNQKLPSLPNGYDTNLYIIRHNIVISQSGNVTINPGYNLFVNGNNNVANIVTYNTAGYNLTVGRDLNIGGTGIDTGLKKLNGTNSVITVGRDFNLTEGTTEFTHAGSTVILNGGNQSINGSVTFNNLSKTVSSAATLTFEAGKTTTIVPGGMLTLKGLSGQLLTLASSTGSSVWNLSVGTTTTKDISFVNVSWSDASSSDVTQKPINPAFSVNGGNNIDWF